MSGCKYSLLRLQRQLDEKFSLLRAIGHLQAEVAGRRGQITALLDGISAGLRATFSKEIQQAQNWLDRQEALGTRDWGIDLDRVYLLRAHDSLQRFAAEGQQLQARLLRTFTQEADQLGQQLAQRLAEVEGHCRGRQELLRNWLEEGPLQEIERARKEAGRLQQAKQYAALEKLLEAIEADLAHKIAWAEEQEEKHQKRVYLLKAVRQVCAEMGFAEVATPGYERAGDRRSRILLTVDTLDRGRIDFALSLEGISTFSEIAEDRCFEEFGQLSQYLAEEFGIETQFRLAGGEPPPRLQHKGEKDLPDDASMHARA